MTLLQQAKKVRALITKMVEEPYERVKLQRVRGSFHIIHSLGLMAIQSLGLEGTSLVDSLLEDYEKSAIVDEKRENLIKTTAGMIYGGTS